jgi:TatD DNase family protein
MLVDAHAHLDHYTDLLDAALAEIRRHHIFTVSTAMDIPSYLRACEIGARCELVLPTFGIHPWNAPQYADRLAELTPFIEHSPMLGEIGLDFHWVKDASAFPAQRRVLEFFLTAAREQNKIVNLHTKGAEEEILRYLDRFEIPRAIVHWYSGPVDIFRELVARGYHLTIGVEVQSSLHIQALARELPLRQLLTETDNPSGAKWLTGEVGFPHLIRQVVEHIAQLKKTTPAIIAQTVRDNCVGLLQGEPGLSEMFSEGVKM